MLRGECNAACVVKSILGKLLHHYTMHTQLCPYVQPRCLPLSLCPCNSLSPACLSAFHSKHHSALPSTRYGEITYLRYSQQALPVTSRRPWPSQGGQGAQAPLQLAYPAGQRCHAHTHTPSAAVQITHAHSPLKTTTARSQGADVSSPTQLAHQRRASCSTMALPHARSRSRMHAAESIACTMIACTCTAPHSRRRQRPLPQHLAATSKTGVLLLHLCTRSLCHTETQRWSTACSHCGLGCALGWKRCCMARGQQDGSQPPVHRRAARERERELMQHQGPTLWSFTAERAQLDGA